MATAAALLAARRTVGLLRPATRWQGPPAAAPPSGVARGGERWLGARLVGTTPVWSAVMALPAVHHGDKKVPEPGKGIPITFVTPEGERIDVVAAEGDNILDLAHANNVELEGACEASLACSTCHVILEPAVYEKLPEPTDEENDMLDLAFGLTETSRLGCQVIITPEMAGAVIRLPSATRNMAVDGYKPKPH